MKNASASRPKDVDSEQYVKNYFFWTVKPRYGQVEASIWLLALKIKWKCLGGLKN
jgi:hypothetical protein